MNKVDNYQLLISKLDAFIRKFYLNKAIKGSLYSTGLVIALFLVFSVSEYFLYFSPFQRKLLLFSYLTTCLVFSAIWIFLPLLKYFRLGSIISHNEAANIIGKHFSDVQDKLTNILDLNAQLEYAPSHSNLILAGIDQKSEEIKLVPFRSAINLKDNKKYLRYALPPLLVFLTLLFAAPSIITDSTFRIINNNTEFEKPAPFTFSVHNNALEANQFEDFNLVVKIEGNTIPNEAYILIGDYRYKLRKENNNTYSYTFRNVSEPIKFKFNSGSVFSKDYQIKVMSKPVILGFEVNLNYPKYTSLKSESLSNVGDLIIPEGTQVNWNFNAQYTQRVSLKFSEPEFIETNRLSESEFVLNRKINSSTNYSVFVSSYEVEPNDSVNYYIKVVKDAYPSIAVKSYPDQYSPNYQYFIGDIKDDYGFSNLIFHYSIKKKEFELDSSIVIKSFDSNIKEDAFQFDFDFGLLEMEPGDEVVYYFEILDNDAINGFKSSFTERMKKNLPTKAAYKEKEQANEEKIKDNLKSAINENKKIQESVENIKNNLLQKKDLEWQDKKELEQLIKRQESLKNTLEEINDRFKENIQNQEITDSPDEETLEQQEALEELLEELENEELNEILQKIEELMDQLDKEQLLEMLEKVNKDENVLETDLERLLELFQKMELEKEMKEAIEQLQELSEKIDESAQNLENNQNTEETNEAASKDLEEFEEQLKEVNENLEKINEKNSGNNKPQELNLPQENINRAEKQLNNSKSQLKNKKNKEAAKDQKKAAEELNNAAKQMEQQMQDSKMEQMQEDMAALRQLMENLIGLSFEQESLMEEINGSTINTPQYVSLVQNQFKLKDDFGLVKDSLEELAKRVFQLEAFVTEKVADVEENLNLSIDYLEERKKPEAGNFQQRVMTFTNDLALMLSEVMQQMQQQMSQMMAGNQMCSQPKDQQGGGEPQNKLSEGQKSLNQEMKEAGKKPGGSSAKEFAEMAAKQAALRKALQEKIKELQGQGKGSPILQELVEEMDKVETDLVNKKLTNEMMKRQEDILTKLLDHEKAEREQEWENERKSETAEKIDRVIPPALEEYLKKRKAEIEEFRKVAPGLTPFYRQLLENYLGGIGTKFE